MLTRIASADAISSGEVLCKSLHGREILLLRNASDIVAYLNWCPHLGVPLNWDPDRFLDNSGEFIRCSNHGALFTLNQGLCVQGPCQNEALVRVELTLKNGEIFIDTDNFPATDW